MDGPPPSGSGEFDRAQNHRRENLAGPRALDVTLRVQAVVEVNQELRDLGLDH